MLMSRPFPKPPRFSVGLLLSILLLGGPAVAGAERQQGEDPPLPPGVEEDWWTTVRQNIAAAEYHVTWRDEVRPEGPTGSWQAPNRAHGFRTRFLEQGVRLAPRAGQETDWEWGLDFIAWGREGAMRTAARPVLSPYEGRIDYDRGDVVEWYVNSPDGLKQGFTILAAPGDAATGRAAAGGNGHRRHAAARLRRGRAGDRLPRRGRGAGPALRGTGRDRRP